jgi:hypothetical protein
MAGWTNQGKLKALDWIFRGATLPTNFYVALVTSTASLTADTSVLSEVSEIASGNGYDPGGISLNLNSTDFDVLSSDNTNDRALVQIKDISWVASGTFPATGAGAKHAILTDDDATVSSREALYYWSLSSARTVTDGRSLTLRNLEIRINES